MEKVIECIQTLRALLNAESLRWLGAQNYSKCKTARNCDRLFADLCVIQALLSVTTSWAAAFNHFMSVDISIDRVRACFSARGAGAEGMKDRRRAMMIAYRNVILAMQEALPMLRVKQEDEQAFGEFVRVKTEPVD